ncbi:MAG: hypothetical protein U0821_04655 [Chloroflexota bacterium]
MEPQKPVPTKLRRLHELAERVTENLRQHRQPAVRMSAALLLAASLAACSPSGSAAPPVPTVAPLAQEVRLGLPGSPGRYDVNESSVTRDEQGVYRFDWTNPLTGATGQAATSLLRLAPSDVTRLEMAGTDPILHLRRDAEIPLVVPDRIDTIGSVTGTPTPVPVVTGGHTVYAHWSPFVGYTGSAPAYHDPPASTVAQGDRVTGSRTSTAPLPSGDRTLAKGMARPGGGIASARGGLSGSGPTASGAARPSSTSWGGRGGFSGGLG